MKEVFQGSLLKWWHSWLIKVWNNFSMICIEWRFLFIYWLQSGTLKVLKNDWMKNPSRTAAFLFQLCFSTVDVEWNKKYFFPLKVCFKAKWITRRKRINTKSKHFVAWSISLHHIGRTFRFYILMNNKFIIYDFSLECAIASRANKKCIKFQNKNCHRMILFHILKTSLFPYFF